MMKCIIVESSEEFERAVEEQEELNYRLVAISNAGLVGEQRRLTFLPSSSFKDTQEVEKEPRPLKDIITDLM